ncbi:MAG: J domain-containing protein [Myxococcales bacterium]|nr:J domain-containing protein [Myxococcales bacterium]
MTRFADVLDRMLALPTDPPPGAPFERSLRAFEAALGDAPSDAAAAAWQAEWAVALGVTLPCSVGELKKAFRRLAFATHPDRPGGSHRAFLEAQAALQQALESFAAARRTRSGAGHYARQAAHVPPCTSTQSTYG